MHVNYISWERKEWKELRAGIPYSFAIRTGPLFPLSIFEEHTLCFSFSASLLLMLLWGCVVGKSIGLGARGLGLWSPIGD